ncbi:MAG: hypothetical protein LBH93_08615 [Chitinispirillales bacterium]|jgi:hypothetical protein|nr:hypothetical protein [Chitinispirillales bacterium]
MIYDGTRFVILGDDIINFTENGDKFEQAFVTEKYYGVSMAYSGDVYVTVVKTEIETLSKGTYE